MIPHFKNKLNLSSAVKPHDYIRRYFKRIKTSEYLIIVYSDHFINILLERFNVKRVSKRIYSLSNKLHFYKSDIGAPNVAICLEEMSVLGYRNFISLGVAGFFGDYAKPGDIIICRGALRDEGTSYHYLSDVEEFSYPSPKFLNKIEKVIVKNNLKFAKELSWTTDAPYRETHNEFIVYLAKGIKCVDMETSALYSVGKVKNLNTLSIFIISDIYDINLRRWKLYFDSKPIKESFIKTINCLINCL